MNIKGKSYSNVVRRVDLKHQFLEGMADKSLQLEGAARVHGYRRRRGRECSGETECLRLCEGENVYYDGKKRG